jgi:hypothetical protein
MKEWITLGTVDGDRRRDLVTHAHAYVTPG